MSGHEFKVQDVLVPFHSKSNTKQEKKEPGPVLQRYCHVYKEGELHELFQKLPWVKVEQVYFDTGNCK